MDSSSSSPTFTSRDGSPAEEDDGSLSVAAGLAKEAALLFEGGKLLDCLKILKKLLHCKGADPKVQHNIAIVENLQDGCADPKRLVEALVSIKKQVDELSHASGEQLQGSGDGGIKTTAGMKGSNSAARQLSSVFDTMVVVFNIAVIWFHLHQYAKSFSYLDTLYQNIGPIDEGMILHVCLLLLDVALLSHHPSRFADVISYVERVFLIRSLNNQVEEGNSTQPKSSLVSKSSSLPTDSTIHNDASHSDSVTLENSLTRSLSEEALEDESSQLLSPLNNVHNQNIERLITIAPSNDHLRTQEEESLPDLRLKLHLYKVRLFLLVRDFKEARHELELAMSTTHGKDHSLAICLKSQLEYACGNFEEASRVLKESNNWKDPENPSMFWNNLGCIDYRLGNFNSSGAYFSRALSSSSHKLKEKPQKLVTISKDKTHLITYNCGLNSLACGKPINAARCFYKASLFFDQSPLLWLRMAECCLMALEKGRSDIRVNVIGRGKWRYLALECERMPNGEDKFVVVEDKLYLSMPFARKCLVNVLFLLDYPEGISSISNKSGSPPSFGVDESNRDSEALNIVSGSNSEVIEQNGGNYENGSLQNSLLGYEYICLKEKRLIKQAALADLAYVELELENYRKALFTARSLLELPDCLKIYVFLGTMYMTEALCMLNRHEEAANCLMKFVSSGDLDLPYNQEDYEKFLKKVGKNEGLNGGPTDNESRASMFTGPEQARGIFHANYASNLVLRGDFEQAQQCVTKALSDIPNCSTAVLTAIYLDLKRGYTKEAVARLKQHKCVAFVKGGLPSNVSS